MNDELLRVGEVLARVKLSKQTLYRLMLLGTFPRPLKAGRTALWRASDLDAWAAGLSRSTGLASSQGTAAP